MSLKERTKINVSTSNKLSKEIRICKLSAKLISCGTYVQIKKIMLIIPENKLLLSNSTKNCKCVIGHLSSKPKVNRKINWHNNIYTCHHEIIQKNYSKCVIVKLYSNHSLKKQQIISTLLKLMNKLINHAHFSSSLKSLKFCIITYTHVTVK